MCSVPLRRLSTLCRFRRSWLNLRYKAAHITPPFPTSQLYPFTRSAQFSRAKLLQGTDILDFPRRHASRNISDRGGNDPCGAKCIFQPPIFESDYGPIEKYGKISKWMTINNETTNTVWSMAKEMETAFTKDNIYVQVLWLASSMAGEGMM